MNDMPSILKGATLFTGGDFLHNHSLVIRDGWIEAVIPDNDAPSDGDVVALPADTLLAPGFIDVQVNGAGGVLFNGTPTPQAIETIGNALRPFGVTGYLPTFITDRREGMAVACLAAVNAVGQPGSTALGIHLEGPFIGKKRPGVHDPQYVRVPDDRDIELIIDMAQALGERARLLLTLAPETVPDAVVTRLVQAGVVVSIGHSGCTFDQAKTTLQAGATGFTHLFNAMPPIGNREPGPVGAALDAHGAFAGIIADGHHVHPALLRTTLKAKDPGSIFLVSDAMPPVGTDATSFVLYGKTIYRRGGKLVTADGVLAGADIDMLSAVRNCITLLGLDLAEALRMAALYPARFLKLDQLIGAIAPKMRADLVLLRHWQEPARLSVATTWVAGRRAG